MAGKPDYIGVFAAGEEKPIARIAIEGAEVSDLSALATTLLTAVSVTEAYDSRFTDQPRPLFAIGMRAGELIMPLAGLQPEPYPEQQYPSGPALGTTTDLAA